ncbi:ribonuclease H-like domain-containing protein [Tanacetum coccineum]
MNNEMKALFRNNTWVLADLPVKRKTIGFFLALLVYVDDIVVTSNNSDEIEKFKVFLASKFQINDLSSLKYFLGIEVLENKNGLSLSQRKYCLELMCDYGLLACKPAAIPMQQNISLNHVESEKDKKLKIHCLSRHMRSHFSVGLRVLKYLKMSLDAGFIEEFRSPGKGLFPDPLYCDSTSVIQIAANLVFHKKTKHFKIDVHLVRDKVASGVISTVKVNSANQVVDIFTKCLSIPQHKQFCEKLNMVDMFEV